MTGNRFAEFAAASNALEVAIEEHRDQCKSLISTYVGQHDRERLLQAADDRAYAALKAAHALECIADEADSLSRHLNVSSEAAA